MLLTHYTIFTDIVTLNKGYFLCLRYFMWITILLQRKLEREMGLHDGSINEDPEPNDVGGDGLEEGADITASVFGMSFNSQMNLKFVI